MALRELRISDLAIIRRTTLAFDDGFSVITGETGSGKSLGMLALRAIVGEKIDNAAIAAGASQARVVAVFDNIAPDVAARLDDLGLPADDLLTMQRDLVRDGRGTCRINGALTSLAGLRSIGEMLLELTTQGASGRLLSAGWQRDVLDAAGGVTTASALDAMAKAVIELQRSRTTLAALHSAAATSAAEIARARDVVAELEPMNLSSGEQTALDKEASRLRNAAAIRTAFLSLHAAADGEGGAADILATACHAVRDTAALSSEVSDLALVAEGIVEQLREFAVDTRQHADNSVLDDDRLAGFEDRLSDLHRIARRWGSVDAAIDDLEASRILLDRFDDSDARVAAAVKAVAEAESTTAAAAMKLRRQRQAVSRHLEQAVTKQLRQLEMPHARFRIVLASTADGDGVDIGERVRCTAHGADSIEFRLSTTRDGVPLPLAEGPSGGEVSRLALSLRAVVAGADGGTMVLDEVDTGIGGETAARVGEVLARIGAGRQVLAITHRPEIAARAQGHLLVSRDGDRADCRAVHGEARVDEMARLLSGRRTRAARVRAAELLAEGGQPVARASGD